MNDLFEEEGAKYNAVFRASVDGIITIDKRGTIESLNPAASVLFGYEIEEVRGQNVKILMPEPHKKKHDEYLENYNTTGKKKIIGIGREVYGLKKDGTTFPFRLAVSEVNIEGEIIFAGFIHDLSLQKKAEQELLELTQELEAKIKERTEDLAQVIEETQHVNRNLNEEVEKRKLAEAEAKRALDREVELGELKSRFVSMASHEFRTPLTGILSSIGLIGKYNTPEQAEKKQKHIQRIRTSVQNLTSILNDFLSLDKLQAGKIKCNPFEFNYQSLFKELVDEMNQMKKRGQEIISRHEGGDIFYTDPNILKNILLNLCSNAIKYTPEHKTIQLKSQLSNGKLSIEIEDQGIGIPEEEQKHLFERFFRAKNAANIQGTGLGLNIVKEYVQLLGGEIDFKSAEQEGSTFNLVLPTYKEMN